jgi:hypothetical protein
MGYLSAESRGLKLINDYIELDDRLTIALNNKAFTESLSAAMNFDFTYLPNIITPVRPERDLSPDRDYMNVGCFGALRLLKNQCFQAICAIRAADELDKKLYFHITPNPLAKDDPVLANLRELFLRNRHELVIHDWMPNDKFMGLIRRMDIGIQLSYTESFNIVAADFVSNNRLILVSDAIEWMPDKMKASTIDYDDVVNKLVVMYRRRNSEILKNSARKALFNHNVAAMHEWDAYLRSHPHHR